MKIDPRKGSLEAPRRRLVELMQSVNFGRIEQLYVRHGLPMFNPPPRVVREIKLGGDNGPRQELDFDDYKLKSRVAQLFQQLDEIGDGVVELIGIKSGLPYMLLVERPAA